MHPCGFVSVFTFTASYQVDPLRSFTFIREEQTSTQWSSFAWCHAI